MPSSEFGIQELAEIDHRNQSALSSAETLKTAATASFTFIFLAFVLGAWVPEWTFSVGFIAGVCLGVFWFKFVRWILEYSNNEYPDESYRRSMVIWQQSSTLGVIGSLLLAALFYVRSF